MAKRYKEQRAEEHRGSPSYHKRLAQMRLRTELQLAEDDPISWAEGQLQLDPKHLKQEIENAHAGAKQRAAGQTSPGRRGKYGVSQKELPEAWRNAVGKLKRAFPDIQLDQEKCEAKDLPEAFHRLCQLERNPGRNA